MLEEVSQRERQLVIQMEELQELKARCGVLTITESYRNRSALICMCMRVFFSLFETLSFPI